MEQHGILDSLNEIHLFCLHFVYMPRIERATLEFQNQWNNHGLSTQNGRSPLQLWHAGVINNIAQQNTAVDSIFHIDESFGVDTDGPLPCVQTNNNVVIPDIAVGINDTTFSLMQCTFNPLQDDGNYGIDLFCSVVTFLEEHNSLSS